MNLSLNHLLLSFSLLCSLIPSSQGQTEQFNRIISERFDENGPGINVLVAKKGEVLFHHASGLEDVKSKTEMNPSQVFRIGSITKQFTAAGILMLVEKGEIDLVDPIGTLIPNLPEDKKVITIEQLLTHTSGMGNQNDVKDWQQHLDALDPEAPLQASVREIFINEPLAFSAGTAFKYSNFGYLILGQIIESVSGTSYKDYLSDNIFTPLQMRNTTYDSGRMTDANRALGHSSSNASFLPSAGLDMRVPYAAGGLVSTVDDLYTWHKSLLAGQVLGEDLLTMAHTAHILPNGKSIPYGYGWMVGNVHQHHSVKHDGIINGFTTYALHIPEEDVYVIILSNCDCTGDLEYTTSQLAALAIGYQQQLVYESFSVGDLAEFAGIYENLEGQRMHITLQDGQLKYHPKGGSKRSLIPTSPTRFQVGDDALSFIDIVREDNRVTAFHLHDLGLGATYKRTMANNLALNELSLTEEQMDHWLGQYEFPAGFTLEIAREGSRVYGHVQGDRKDLRPFAANKFYAVEDDIRLEFEEVEGETIMTMKQGFEMKAKRKEKL